jgi:hypothetical protein
MADLQIDGISGSPLGSPLAQILMADNIEPGTSASYQLCKLIYAFHPLGAKLVDNPVELAQSQGRVINIPGKAEERVRKAFLDEWANLGCDRIIANTVRLARVYGLASVATMLPKEDPGKPLDFVGLPHKKMTFNTFDPLNTAGSLVLNQNPNEVDFLKPLTITVQGTSYHPTRTCIYMNEDPIYLEFTSSTWGYTGRSVYQRALFPLKSFIQSMITDDLVTKKAGVIVAKMKSPGSIINNVMQAIAGVKRQLLKEAVVGNVLNISVDESIESLNLQNIDNSMKTARKNILENIAASAGMPAKLVNSETLAVAFAEGEEDAKAIARYIDKLRVSMKPLYDYFNKICQFRAWNVEFYDIIKNSYPEDYGGKSFNEVFTEWTNRFISTWPSLLTEPDSEKIKVANVKLRSIIAMLQELLPISDPDNKAELLDWASQNFNDLKILFPTPLMLDTEKMAKFKPDPMEMGMPGQKPPGAKKSAFGSGGGGVSAGMRNDSMEELNASVIDLISEVAIRRQRYLEHREV